MQNKIVFHKAKDQNNWCVMVQDKIKNTIINNN